MKYIKTNFTANIITEHSSAVSANILLLTNGRREHMPEQHMREFIFKLII